MKIALVGDITKDSIIKLDNKEAHLSCKLNSTQCEICFNYANKIQVDQLSHSIGGNAANASIALKRLGEDPILVSQIGIDVDSKYLLEELKKADIKTKNIVQSENEQSNNSLIINYKGEKTVFSFHENREYQLPKADADVTYLTSMGKGWLKVYEKFLQGKIIYQPGTRQISRGAKYSKNILAKSKILILNKEEAKKFLGSKQNDIKELLHELLDFGVSEVVITEGKNGAYASDGKEFLKSSIWHQAARIESTGAGDAFASTYSYMRMTGKDITTALKAATINSGKVIQHTGAHKGLLKKNELAILQKRIKIKVSRI